jgi:hypothetical protein
MEGDDVVPHRLALSDLLTGLPGRPEHVLTEELRALLREGIEVGGADKPVDA